MVDVIDQLPHLELMLYYNMGEPFLHKDTVPFLREARKRLPHLVIATNTNGLVLTPAQIHALGTEALMNKIVFSIDGAHPESYARYRVGGDLPRVLRKLTALVETTRAAGNSGRVQIVWQYILFEWNDSEEEVARAKETARHLGIPIEWVMTSGYGASKRFVAGSDAWRRLTDGGGSTAHMAAGTSLQNTRLIPTRGTGDMDVFRNLPVSGAVSDLPADAPPHHPAVRYTSELQTADTVVVAPPGVTLRFDLRVENRTRRPWGEKTRDLFRPGVLMRPAGVEAFRELDACLFEPDGRGAAAGLRVTLPPEPGEYELLLDVIDLVGEYWMHQHGSEPLRLRVHTDVSAAARLGCVLTDARGAARRLLDRLTRLTRPHDRPARTRAELRAEPPAVTAPAGAWVLFEVGVENRSSRRPRPTDAHRLGVRFQTAAGETVAAFPTPLPASAGVPGGRATVHIRVRMPGEPGRYQLVVDVFDPESGRWLSEHGASPLAYPVLVE
jgi:hypothetical protein